MNLICDIMNSIRDITNLIRDITKSIRDMYISRIQITHIANSGLNSKTAFQTESSTQVNARPSAGHVKSEVRMGVSSE